MATCTVRAIDHNGTLVEFSLPSSDAEIVSEELRRRRARALSVTQQFAVPSPLHWFRSEREQADLMVQELSSLLKAGLTVPESIALLSEKESNPAHRMLLQRLLLRLREGDRLSVALTKEGERFPPLLVAMTRASEDVAGLAAAFERYLRYSLLSKTLRRKLIAALIYPTLLICVAFGVTVFLAAFVVPRFASVFADGAQDLPVATAVLLALSRFVSEYGVALGVLGMAAAVAVVAAFRMGTLRVPVEWLEALPILGARVHAARVSRLLMALSALLEAGVPLSQAIELSKRALPTSWSARLAASRQSIEAGFSLSDALTRARASTLVADRLLRVGERSGDLAGMASQAARHHEEDLERFLDRFMRTAEPLLMAFIGIVIGAVVIALYLPLFDLAQWIR